MRRRGRGLRLGAAFVAGAALAVVMPAGGAPGDRPPPPKGPPLFDEESSSRHEDRRPPPPPVSPEIPDPSPATTDAPLDGTIETPANAGKTPPGRAGGIAGPFTVTELARDVSPPLRALGATSPRKPRPLKLIRRHAPARKRVSPRAGQLDPVRDFSAGLKIPAPSQTFDGVGNADNVAEVGFGVAPPDTNGDVGRNHYVQWVNLTLAVYDKNGALVMGPMAGNSLWAGFGGLCETTNEGDPIVLYDALADRWLLSQFAFDTGGSGNPVAPFVQCIAVSTTGDPTGAYYRYAFTMPDGHLNDYPKLGVWDDAYYMTDMQFIPPAFGFGGVGAFAFERDAMLTGAAATGIYFNLSTAFGGMLPTDHDGLRPPAPGTKNRFIQFNDDAWGYPQDELEIWEFTPNFAAPASSTFTFVDTVATAAFDSDLCGYAANCIDQPGTAQNVDAISDRLMHRLAYRNFGTHESYVVDHSVDVGADIAGVRWYELRNPGGAPTIHQQGTYSPDSTSRWMGSVAMDGSGNLAVGYSASSGTVFPSIRYAGRLASDPLGTLAQGEATLQAGAGSQTGTARWGDYSMMSVDPADDCTFWFTSEYYSATSSAGWKTRIGKFQFAECTPPPTCDGQTATLLGTDGNDLLNATTSDDVVVAGAGHDQVVGGNGNDRVCGGDGNDILQGNDGTDVLVGGLGNDALNGGSGNDNLDAGAGHDSLRGGQGNDVLTGGLGIDWLTFSEATAGVTANLLTGTATGEGTDTLSGIEHLLGSAFNDTFTGDDQPNILRGEGGTDTLIGNGGPDQLLGGAGDDNATLDGGPGDDFLSGGDGVDKLLGGAGNDELQGGPGDDGGTTGGLDGGTGSDRLYGQGGADKLVGGSDNDTLDGGSENDELDGGTGHDTLKGGAGNDSLTGGDQADWATFGDAPGPVTANLATGAATGDGTDTLTGIEFLFGSPFDDTLIGDAQPNILWGEAGTDTLTGGDGPDQLLGGAGDDDATLDGGPGDDFLSGGDGIDKLLGGDGNDELQGGPGDDGGTTGGLEGGAGDDVLFGDDGVDSLSGGDGNDALNGGSQNDTLDGDAGLDTLRGGSGNDDLDGGADGDWVTYSEASAAVTVDLSTTPGTGAGGDAGADTIANIGAVQGSAFGDTITGNDDANILLGEGGADSLFGNGGGDQVDGGPGDDLTIEGGDGNDYLDAGLGTTAVATPVIGGAGDDLMVGGSGSESFDGGSGDDVIVPFGGPDTIIGGTGLDMLGYEPSPAAVSVNLELGTVADDGYGFADTVPQTGGLSTVEILIGSAFDDVLVGDIGPNEIHGLAGDDFLDGRAGFDFLDGGAHVVGDECVNGEALFDCEL